MTNLVFPTGELYLNNVVDFPVSFLSLMLSVIVFGFIVIVLCTVCAHIFLTKNQFKLFYIIICIFTFMEYMQGLFLNGYLKTLEGVEQTWGAKTAYINGIIWLSIIFVGIWLFIRNNNILKLYRIVCIYVCSIQMVSLVYMGITTDFSKKDEYILTTDGTLEVDDENNVIVFVLDWFDGQILEWIENEAPAFLEPLKDFTNYKNTTSCYSYTDMSIPYMLSGIKYNNEDTLEEWYSNAYMEESLLWAIDRLGYDIGIYTLSQYVDQSVQDIVINYAKAERGCRFSDSVALMLQCARYRNLPFLVKDRFAYSTEDIEALSVEENKYMTNNDVWIYNDLIGDYRIFGKAFDEIDAEENRIREFIYGKLGKAPFIHYNICGDVRNIEDWVISQ